ncbi:MAG TPA: hypothetical protein VMF08_05455 [Candidatus Sulfotelmatobacter sp.]|nr:hypothetical protein [Candidatus Sulfotelmatobacter sp.]
MESNNKKHVLKNVRMTAGPQNVVFAQSPDARIVVGVVTNSQPSSLTLLSAGAAGMAARRARRERAK